MDRILCSASISTLIQFTCIQRYEGIFRSCFAFLVEGGILPVPLPIFRRSHLDEHTVQIVFIVEGRHSLVRNEVTQNSPDFNCPGCSLRRTHNTGFTLYRSAPLAMEKLTATYRRLHRCGLNIRSDKNCPSIPLLVCLIYSDLPAVYGVRFSKSVCVQSQKNLLNAYFAGSIVT